MDFTLPADIADLCARVRSFLESEVLPLEQDRSSYDQYDNIRIDLCDAVRARARQAGLWAPQMPRDAAVSACRSSAGPPSTRRRTARSSGRSASTATAPDDGNMMVLARSGTPAQKERWLQPIIDGKVRSAFVMTEPHPGVGSDPGGMMLTRAERQAATAMSSHGTQMVHLGGRRGQHFILVARTSDDPRHGLSAFLFDRDEPGWRIVRRIAIMGPEEHGGLCELEFDGLEIPPEQRLLEEGDGLQITQIRLGPARLTHCMRWLGLAKRCLEIAQAYVVEREAFGVQLPTARACRSCWARSPTHRDRPALTMHAAWALDQGELRAQGGVDGEDPCRRHPAARPSTRRSSSRRAGLFEGHGARMDLSLCPRARLVDGASEVHHDGACPRLCQRATTSGAGACPDRETPERGAQQNC